MNEDHQGYEVDFKAAGECATLFDDIRALNWLAVRGQFHVSAAITADSELLGDIQAADLCLVRAGSTVPAGVARHDPNPDTEPVPNAPVQQSDNSVGLHRVCAVRNGPLQRSVRAKTHHYASVINWNRQSMHPFIHGARAPPSNGLFRIVSGEERFPNRPA